MFSKFSIYWKFRVDQTQKFFFSSLNWYFALLENLKRFYVSNILIFFPKHVKIKDFQTQKQKKKGKIKESGQHFLYKLKEHKKKSQEKQVLVCTHKPTKMDFSRVII